VPRVDRVDFSVNVGATVPSHVHLVAVPDTLIEIHSAWRGDEFFVVRDEIVIVDHSRKIVAVIPGGNRHASSGSSTTIVENMTPTEIRQIQTVLIQRGFLHAKADGKIGTETREAVIAFQRKEGIEATGRIDTSTVSSLGLSGKVQARGTQGQKGGGAATTGSSLMSDQKSAPATSGQTKTPSTSGQNNMPLVGGQNNQGATSASQTPSKANENQSMTPKASSQPLKNDTTGQGSAKLQNPDENRDKNRSEAK
jgi:peptidoglycan hydrolase-like protein with peptidoglycan-binding domain